jgi:hypothetical protein
MLSALYAEMFPVRPYPLDQTTWIPAISTAAVEPIFGLLGLKVPPIGQLFIVEDGGVVRFGGKVAARATFGLLLARRGARARLALRSGACARGPAGGRRAGARARVGGA